MAIPVKVMWSDSGAPALTTAASSLLAVLDFALLPHGWTKEFSATDIAVYRAPAGNRKFYRILDDNSVVSGSSYSAVIKAYDTMTDASTGSGWGSTTYIRKAYSTGNKRWMVLVDDYGFLLITQPAGTTATDASSYPCVPHYIGEDIAALPGVANRDIICGAHSTTNYGSSGICVPTAHETVDGRAASFANRNVAGTITNISCYTFSLKIFTASGSNVLWPTGNESYAPYTYPYNGNLLYGRAMLSDGSNASTIGGYVPWFYHLFQKGSGFNSFAQYTDGDKTFMAFRTCYVSGYIEQVYGALTTYYWGAFLVCINESR